MMIALLLALGDPEIREPDEAMFPRAAHVRGPVRLAPGGPGVPFDGDAVLLGRDGDYYRIAPPEPFPAGFTVVRRVRFEWSGAIGDGPGRFVDSTRAVPAGFEFRRGIPACAPDARFYVAVSEVEDAP